MSKTADEQKIDKAVEEIIQLLEARPGEWEIGRGRYGHRELGIEIVSPEVRVLIIEKPFWLMVNGDRWARLNNALFNARNHQSAVKAAKLSEAIAKRFAKEMGVETELPSEPLGEPRVVIESRKLNWEVGTKQELRITYDLSGCSKAALEEAAVRLRGQRYIQVHFFVEKTWGEVRDLGLKKPTTPYFMRRLCWPSEKVVKLVYTELDSEIQRRDLEASDWVVAWVE